MIFYLNHLKTTVLKLASMPFGFSELIDHLQCPYWGAVLLIYCFKMLANVELNVMARSENKDCERSGNRTCFQLRRESEGTSIVEFSRILFKMKFALFVGI